MTASMREDLEIRRRRAAYRACHRGTKEMDFVIGRYAEARLGTMTPDELSVFERFLAMPDPVLTDWFAQSSTPEDAAFAALVAGLRTFHGLAAPAAVAEDAEGQNE